MVLGAMCAYVLARFTFFGNRIIYYLMLAGLTFPIFLAIVPLFFTLQELRAARTPSPGLIITYVAFALPFTVFFLYSFFKSLPDEIAEAAAIDGAGEWQTFFLVMLPMARNGFASVLIFNFLGLWNQFLIPVALNTNIQNYVLSQRMAAFASQAGYAVDFGALFAAVVITVAAGADRLHHLPAAAAGVGVPGHDEVRAHGPLRWVGRRESQAGWETAGSVVRAPSRVHA